MRELPAEVVAKPPIQICGHPLPRGLLQEQAVDQALHEAANDVEVHYPVVAGRVDEGWGHGHRIFGLCMSDPGFAVLEAQVLPTVGVEVGEALESLRETLQIVRESDVGK